MASLPKVGKIFGKKDTSLSPDVGAVPPVPADATQPPPMTPVNIPPTPPDAASVSPGGNVFQASPPVSPPMTPAPTTSTPVSPPVPPPAGSSPMPPTSPGTPGDGEVAAPPEPKRKGLPKNIMFIVGGVLVLGLVIFAVIQFVLPLFSPKDEVITLTWWGLWEDTTVVAPLIAEYEAANPNVKINYVKQAKQDYRERLTSAIAKGEGPDIFRFHNTWVPMFSRELDAIPADVMSPADFSQTYYPVVAADLTSGPSIVGLPLDFDTIGLFINEEIFDANGKVAPTTWVDLRQTALDLTIQDENGVIQQSGAALGRVENVDHWQEILALMMLQNGASLTNPTGELAEAAVIFFTLFSTTDGVWDETLPTSTVAFAAGKTAMYFGPSWRVFEIQAQNPNLKFKVVPVPQLPKDTPDQPDIAYATYWSEGVWARSENKEVAWDFLKYMASEDSLKALYTSAASTRLFGEPYPIASMGTLLSSDPIVGAFVAQGPNASSWYLASRTFDGPTGINTQLSGYFEDAINTVIEGGQTDKALETAAAGVAQVLKQYGLNTAR